MAHELLTALDLTAAELATLRGASPGDEAIDLNALAQDSHTLRTLHRTLLAIGSARSLAVAERLRAFASQRLGLALAVAVPATGDRCSPAQLFAQHRELWIWSASPFDEERAEYWEQLCSGFLDQPERLLVYFVPTIDIADRLALRFETELHARQYDEDDQPCEGARGFGATVFIIVTNLAATMPYTVVASPGTPGLALDGVAPTGWTLGPQAQAFSALSRRYTDGLIAHARAAGMGHSRVTGNFFPLGQPLNRSGLPFADYRRIDQLIGIRTEQAIGLFDGTPWAGWRPRTQGSESAGFGDAPADAHPLKFHPFFIRAYRKKAGDLSKQIPARPTAGDAEHPQPPSRYFDQPQTSDFD